MSDVDISREACEKTASELHWHGTLYRAQNNTTGQTQDDNRAAMIIALRTALDRAEADKAAAVEACSFLLWAYEKQRDNNGADVFYCTEAWDQLAAAIHGGQS